MPVCVTPFVACMFVYGLGVKGSVHTAGPIVISHNTSPASLPEVQTHGVFDVTQSGHTVHLSVKPRIDMRGVYVDVGEHMQRAATNVFSSQMEKLRAAKAIENVPVEFPSLYVSGHSILAILPYDRIYLPLHQIQASYLVKLNAITRFREMVHWASGIIGDENVNRSMGSALFYERDPNAPFVWLVPSHPLIIKIDNDEMYAELSK